jgi:uncharacterized protein
MALSDPIPFERLWRTVSAQFLRATSIHGPSHWRRVERNGLLLAEQIGVDVDVVRLFALFHDSRRETDGWDPEHGARGAEYAAELRGHVYELTDERFEKLRYACVWHTDGTTHEDVTIAGCWDADRLDLGRVGVMPDPKRMGTEIGRRIAEVGSVELFLEMEARSG